MSAAEDAKAKYDRLWRALRGVRTPTGGALAWRELPLPGALPSPWAVWTLIGLFRHRRRQAWVGEVVTTRLGGDLGQIASCGALGHPEDRPQSGVVPGLIEWEFYFHGRGCCLTHRVTGEQVDVDFFGDHADGFDVHFYVDHLRSLREPRAPERRLIDLHPSIETVRLAFDELCGQGLLADDEGCRAPRLSPCALEHEEAVADFCAAWEDRSRRPWLAGLIGDWAVVAEATRAAGDRALASLASERAATARRARAAQLAGDFEADGAAWPCLQGLADLGAEELPAMLARALRGEVSGATSTALEIVQGRSDAAGWCPEVYRLFGRLDPSGDAPHPYLWTTAARFLLRHGYGTAEIAEALASAGSHGLGEAALLALDYAPSAAVGLFRRTLRSGVPINRLTAAAALALIDRPWSRAELLAVLAGTDDQATTAECRAALAESRDPAARQAARHWEERNPHEPEVGRFVTMREMSLRQAPEWPRHEMDKLRDRVISLADREPPAGG